MTLSMQEFLGVNAKTWKKLSEDLSRLQHSLYVKWGEDQVKHFQRLCSRWDVIDKAGAFDSFLQVVKRYAEGPGGRSFQACLTLKSPGIVGIFWEQIDGKHFKRAVMSYLYIFCFYFFFFNFCFVLVSAQGCFVLT